VTLAINLVLMVSRIRQMALASTMWRNVVMFYRADNDVNHVYEFSEYN